MPMMDGQHSTCSRTGRTTTRQKKFSGPLTDCLVCLQHERQEDDLADELRRTGSGGAGPSGRPLKVHLHKKSGKELSELRVVQELQAHAGGY